MGKWRVNLEIFKMAFYMAFPVGLFYAFNRPEIFFEEDIIELRKKMYPPDDPAVTGELKRKIRELQMRQQQQELERQERHFAKIMAEQSSSASSASSAPIPQQE